MLVKPTWNLHNNMSNTLILLIGPPCAGKSTWSRGYVTEHPKTLRFNRDEVRMMLQGRPVLDSVDESIVTSMIVCGITEALSLGRNVIVDQTNCKLKYLKGFINAFGDRPDVDIKFKILNQSIDVLLERNKSRAINTGIPAIPEHVIHGMHNGLQSLLNSEEFKTLAEKYECLV